MAKTDYQALIDIAEQLTSVVSQGDEAVVNAAVSNLDLSAVRETLDGLRAVAEQVTTQHTALRVATRDLADRFDDLKEDVADLHKELHRTRSGMMRAFSLSQGLPVAEAMKARKEPNGKGDIPAAPSEEVPNHTKSVEVTVAETQALVLHVLAELGNLREDVVDFGNRVKLVSAFAQDSGIKSRTSDKPTIEQRNGTTTEPIERLHTRLYHSLTTVATPNGRNERIDAALDEVGNAVESNGEQHRTLDKRGVGNMGKKTPVESHGHEQESEALSHDVPDAPDSTTYERTTVAKAKGLKLAPKLADLTGLSVSTVRRRLNAATGRTLVSTVFFDYWPCDENDMEPTNEEETADEEIDSDTLGAITVARARNADLHKEISTTTRLAPTTVRRRLNNANGRSLLRTVFSDRWPEPDDEETQLGNLERDRDLGDMTVSGARDQDLVEGIAQLTGYAISTVRRRLEISHGSTHLRNVFAGRWPNP